MLCKKRGRCNEGAEIWTDKNGKPGGSFHRRGHDEGSCSARDRCKDIRRADTDYLNNDYSFFAGLKRRNSTLPLNVAYVCMLAVGILSAQKLRIANCASKYCYQCNLTGDS